MQNALTFIKELDNTDFRKELYSVKGAKSFNSFLESKDLFFTQEEFEDAYNKLLFKAELEEQADRLKNKVSLLGLLLAEE